MRKQNLYRNPQRGIVLDSFSRPSRSRPDSFTPSSSAHQVNSTASKLILPPNPSRKYLLIQNLSGNDIYVNFGSPASASPLKGFVIFTNGNYESPAKSAPDSSVHILGVSATQDVSIIEGI